ncbi:hypothetical protein SPRG_15496 [Saprolegnia parasitica CBS 223.65]|uniref:Uncharacterized protein n=1 Tax=Saprolegnia parasitica (strain CBS 223.65) TaxID=695850 RepID=A0A067BYL9_SAPPC|nr:hypothetical protein SPRG_15496 [Saprolegnia parasitica CBS 223.65]KDO19416.1 hypothetical protein SPRG_15496 [Saprolegnia parasitica CBS 223.65]|eukprot:XP_012209883.1 hypothetical protein SPRG_15496 [Saprolegnia parasitica CBS 223.65]
MSNHAHPVPPPHPFGSPHPAASATPFAGNTKCRYAYKDCQNVRSSKQNGDLHTLCEFHRSKANTIQKLYARKKRHLRRTLKAAGITPPPPRPRARRVDPIPYHNDSDSTGDDGTSNNGSLTEDDVAILRELI